MGTGVSLVDIDENLKLCNVIILIVTPGLKKSKAARREINYAMTTSKIIIPYVRGNTKIPNQLGQTWIPIKFQKSKGSIKANLNKLHDAMWNRLNIEINWNKAISERKHIRTRRVRLRRS